MSAWNRRNIHVPNGWGAGFLRDFAHDPAGVPDRHHPGRDVLRHHAPGPDHRRAPDRHTRADDGAAAKPDVVLDRDQPAELAAGGALDRIERMVGCQQLDRRRHLHAVADRDRDHVEDHAVEVHEDVVAERDVVAVVAEERRPDIGVRAEPAEKLAQNVLLARAVVVAQQALALRAFGDQLRIAGEVHLAGEHLVLLRAAQLSPTGCRRCSIAASSFSITGPSWRRILRRSHPVRVTRRMRVLATTVALRCCFSRTPASPKKSPGPSSATTSPPTITCALPSTIANKS